MILVARIEKTIDGKTYGPFTAQVYDKDNIRAYLNYVDNIGAIPPEPRDDGIAFQYGMVCGFTEGYQGDRWLAMRDYLDGLLAAGMEFNLFQVPIDKLHIGETQCCWWPGDATKVKSLTTDELYDFVFRSVDDE